MFVIFLGLVWGGLLSIMAVRWAAVRTLFSPTSVSAARSGHVNPFYVAVLLLSVAAPVLAVPYASTFPRGSRPYGPFMILELLAGLVLFAIGQFRRHRYRRWNGYLVPVIFIILPASLFVLFVLNFAGNYSV